MGEVGVDPRSDSVVQGLPTMEANDLLLVFSDFALAVVIEIERGVLGGLAYHGKTDAAAFLHHTPSAIDAMDWLALLHVHVVA